MASPGRCCLWSCPEQVSPYCSENHQNDAVTGEASAFGVAIAGARSDDEIRRISVKCLRARALVRATGVPELPVASLTTTPWLLANTFFNRDLHPDQTVKNWVFFSLADPPGMWRIWKYYDERNVAEDIRRRRFNLEAPARSTDGGRFTLKKFRLEGFAAVAFVAFYWLTFEASAAGQKGVYTPLVKPIQAPKGFGDHRKRGLETSSGNLGKKRRGEEKAPELISASSRDYNVDMMPKFMMGNGKLVRVLIHTDVTKYLSFKAVDGSYVFVKGKFQKLPVTPMEALKSPLMGIFENRRAGKFFSYVQDYDEKDPKTHNGMDLTKLTTKELIAKFGLDDNTIDFIGHAVALHTNDQHLNQPALDTVMRTKAFARLSAVYGGTYMLNKPECKVEFDEEGKVIGVTCEGGTAKCKKIVCDPSYLPGKVRKIGRVARAIAIMSLPIPNTNDSHSVQVILPQKQLARKSDMYVFCCSYSHNVAPKGKFIAFVSTDAETDNPQTELKAGIDLLGAVNEIFFDMYDRYEPVNEPALDNCFISTSYDATTHFETTVADVLNMYTLITGKERHDNMKNCMLDMMLPKSFVLVLLCNSL